MWASALHMRTNGYMDKYGGVLLGKNWGWGGSGMGKNWDCGRLYTPGS